MQGRIARALGAVGLVVCGTTWLAGQTPGPAAAAPTFSKDVAPILYKNCASCHRPGEIGPMSLLSYDEARPYAKSIAAKVVAGTMPPWHAAGPAGTFLNDRRLSDAEKTTLVRWSESGAPKGDPKDLPPVPTFAAGWEIGKPDVVLSMSTPYAVPASGTIDYQYFDIPTNFTEDKWIQSVEVRPGARKAVHHVLVFAREPQASPRSTPAWRQIPIGTPAPPRPRPAPAAGESSSRPRTRQGTPGTLIATTAPGTNALVYRPGTAALIKAGSILTFQIHYTAFGEATSDVSSVGFVFASQPPEQELKTGAFLNASFAIPPGASDYSVPSAIQFNEDAHIWGLFPHTHLRGKGWEYRLIYPDGRTEVVLSVPKYDFNWQTYYMFTNPIAVPKGARLEAIARYDNSTANRSNPDPQDEVRWGEQTWEEMQYTGITWTVDQQRTTTAGGRQ
jgi:hypothetical protein